MVGKTAISAPQTFSTANSLTCSSSFMLMIIVCIMIFGKNSFKKRNSIKFKQI
jgi:hypothetical protein